MPLVRRRGSRSPPRAPADCGGSATSPWPSSSGSRAPSRSAGARCWAEAGLGKRPSGSQSAPEGRAQIGEDVTAWCCFAAAHQHRYIFWEVNDPDPGLWIVAYSVPAALTLVVSLSPPIAENIVWRSLSDLHSAACVVGSAILGWSLFANAQNNILHEEEGRELFGLVIVTVWMSLCRSSAKNSLGGIRLVIAISLSLFPFAMWLYIYMNAEMRASWPSHCKTVI